MSSPLVVTANPLHVMSFPQRNSPLSLQLQILKSPLPVFGHRRKPLSNSQVEASMTTFRTSSLNIIMCRFTQKNTSTRAISSQWQFNFVLAEIAENAEISLYFTPVPPYSHPAPTLRLPCAYPAPTLRFKNKINSRVGLSSSQTPYFVHSTCQNRSKNAKCIIN